MKTLLVLRHAKSDWSDSEIGDHDRPLNKRGKRDAPRMGRLLLGEHLLPDLIITSSATRARQTAQGVAEASGYAGSIEARDELYLAAPPGYIQVLRGVPDAYQRVMVIGHNPGIEEFVEIVTGKRETLPTAALAEIKLPIDHWAALDESVRGQLRNVWRPRELA